MKKSIRFAVTAALTLGALSVGGGQTYAADQDLSADEHSLGETIVTATRTPIAVRQAPANVAVITAQEIEQNHYRSVSEALEHINGVVVDRASGEEYIRLNGDDRVVVMVDSVRLNNDQGVVNGRAGVDLRMIPSVKNIKRIEVVKGGGSALYGSDAIGGVVNIITKRAAKAQTEVDLRTGSWGTHSYELSHMGTDGTLSWQLTAGIDRSSNMKYKGTDGETHRMPSSDYANDSLSLRLDHRMDNRNSLTLSVMHRTIDANSYYNFNPSSHHDAIYNMVSASYNFKEGTETAGYLRYFGNFKSVDFAGKYDTRVQGAEYQNGWKLGKDHTVVAGVEWRQSHSTNAASGYSNKKITNKAVYVQDTIRFGDKWSLVPGVRLDHHSNFGTHTSPKFAVNYNADKKTRVYASWGRVYKAPTADDLFYYNAGWMSYGDPNLRPESGHTESIGISHEFDARTSLSVDLFQSKLNDAIHWYYNPATFTSTVTNIAHEKKRGMEILFKKKVDAHWSYDLGYSYTHTETKDEYNSTARDYLNHISQPNGGRIGVHYNNGRWHANLLGTMASGLSEYYYGRSRYAAFELNAGYDFAEGGTIYARLRNATNQAYSSYSSYRNPQPARYAEVGVRYQF